MTEWKNPNPVAVLLIPVNEGVVVIRRGIRPCIGALALPGGYVECHDDHRKTETWQEAAVREAKEEMGMNLDPLKVRDFMVRSVPNNIIVIFGIYERQSCIPPCLPTEEATEILITDEPRELCFESHDEALRLYFKMKALSDRRYA